MALLLTVSLLPMAFCRPFHDREATYCPSVCLPLPSPEMGDGGWPFPSVFYSLFSFLLPSLYSPWFILLPFCITSTIPFLLCYVSPSLPSLSGTILLVYLLFPWRRNGYLVISPLPALSLYLPLYSARYHAGGGGGWSSWRVTSGPCALFILSATMRSYLTVVTLCWHVFCSFSWAFC